MNSKRQIFLYTKFWNNLESVEQQNHLLIYIKIFPPFDVIEHKIISLGQFHTFLFFIFILRQYILIILDIIYATKL